MAIFKFGLQSLANPNTSDYMMKRLLKTLALIFPVFCLFSCSTANKVDDYAAYRGLSSRQILIQAEQHLAARDYEKAIDDFSAMDAIFPFGVDAQQAQLDVIYAYYMDNQPDMALASAERYLRLNPRGRDVDYALYMKGLIQFNEKLTWLQKKFNTDTALFDTANKASAFGAFAELVQSYPSSPYSADAMARMQYLRNVIARHEILIANYYYSRHAYVAAINRASAVIAHYNGTSSIVPALKMLVASYHHLGLTRLENKTRLILQATNV